MISLCSETMYWDIRSHVGHVIECVQYANYENVAIECVTCGMVLLDADITELDNEIKSDNLCKCGNPGEDPHTCPYSVDLRNDSEHLCNCCKSCQHECAMDI